MIATPPMLNDWLLELLEAADDITRHSELADEIYAQPAMITTRSQRLREQADALDARDKRIRRLRDAVKVAKATIF